MRFDQLDTVSNHIEVVGYISCADVVPGRFHDHVDGYMHIWFVDHVADLDRSILKLPKENIIDDNYKLAETTNSHRKKEERKGKKKKD